MYNLKTYIPMILNLYVICVTNYNNHLNIQGDW